MMLITARDTPVVSLLIIILIIFFFLILKTIPEFKICVIECVPKENCRESSINITELEPGQVIIKDTSNCCPQDVVQCKKENCPKALNSCPKYYKLQPKKSSVGKCCVENECGN